MEKADVRQTSLRVYFLLYCVQRQSHRRACTFFFHVWVGIIFRSVYVFWLPLKRTFILLHSLNLLPSSYRR